MMFSFAVDYFIMVFVASLGVMQTAASIGGLRGLLVFKNPLVARPLGIAIAIAAIAWFFVVAERNINDYEGGLDSNRAGAAVLSRCRRERCIYLRFYIAVELANGGFPPPRE